MLGLLLWLSGKKPNFSAGGAGGAGDAGSIPGCGKSPEGRHGNPLQCSCLENPHRQSSLVGYNLQGWKESNTTDRLSTHTRLQNVTLWGAFIL